MANTVLGKHTRNVADTAEEVSRFERDFATIQDQPMEGNVAQDLLVKVSLATLINVQVKAYFMKTVGHMEILIARVENYWTIN